MLLYTFILAAIAVQASAASNSSSAEEPIVVTPEPSLVLMAVSSSSSSVSQSHSVSTAPSAVEAPKNASDGTTPLPPVTAGRAEAPRQLTEDVEEAGSAPEGALLEDVENRTREALAPEGSEHNSVVFVAEGTGYVPVTQLRSRVPAQFRPSAPSTTATATNEQDGVEWAAAQTWERRHFGNNHSRVQHIEAECQDDYMKIRVGFNGSFQGLLYSSGYSYDPDCVYINGTGRDYYEFYIQLNRCGTLGKNTQSQDTRKQPAKNFMWNTVTVQYNPMIEEEWDEHFKVTCEYGYDFWKTVTFPFLDVEVATGNPVVFTLSPPECYMEVRHGYGATGTRVSGPVRVGDPLTLLIYMRSKYDGFDIVVNDCYAHNGANKRIQLIDQYGCPVDEKLISRFRGSWSETGVYETQVFAYMKTFRFTGSPALYVECDVRMCHGHCPNQPCHWRNARSRRSTSDNLIQSTQVPQLSENISLFQSLRVLQEGESGDEEASQLQSKIAFTDDENICVKSGPFTALLGMGCLVTACLGVAVALLCFRVKALKKGAPLELTDAEVRQNRELFIGTNPSLHSIDFLTHKGHIN
ncbi:Hypothetical predicted protein [Cloeon dipterum]|uniref:ZP domain-containing protein n=1 Tax=Cloeon dipterum TaxID=197152 RepID=A0A8S1CK40_9INSE|nr:Hypothetical predicted protein [Cloeon dipterum]